MWLLAFFVWILFVNHSRASDTTGMQNDIIPDQAMQIPYGMFCFFTMSELMFTDKMQQVAQSAYRVGAARLVDMKIISTTSYGYENLWGAYFFVQREDYSSIIKYAKSRNTVAFVSTMEIETIENESGLCVLTDVELQPNTYPSTQDCSQCNGGGGSQNQPSAADYQQELASMGVPASYFQMAGNLPSMQTPSGTASIQGGLSPTPSLGASGSAQIPPVGGSAQANLSSTPSLGASGSAQIPPVGASAQANLSPTPSPGVSGSALTPQVGASAQGNLQTPMPTGSNTAQGQSTRYRHQLQSPYPQSTEPPPSTFSNSSAGFSGGVYQPRTNFSGGFGSGGSQQQPSLINGFTFASYSGQYSSLSAQGGASFMNNQ